ncbi:MAG: glycosyltransferase family 2 protein [Bacilli bacterium]|nr:glycosyltransferase family 2 protein [Bacilli bacterium]
MGKLYENASNFNNDWINFQENNTLNSNLNLSIVIPVYHPRYLKEVLNHLSKLDGIYEVVTVFDGLDDNPNSIIKDYNFNFTVVRHNKNYNAPAANNTGAVYADGDLILFLDQDMILSPNFIENAKKLLLTNQKGIVLGFRDTLDYENVPTFENWKEADFQNDWRMKTTINDDYLDLTVSNCGSTTNNCDKNNLIEIYKNTNAFRTLGVKKEKTIAFWDLPSMVISHTLAIYKRDFLEIGGYPEWIVGWGGEDIALGFLAVSNHLPIIPLKVGSYHIKHDPHSGSEAKKWIEMRKNLEKYKQWSSTIDEFPSIDQEECKTRSKVLYKSKKF